MQHNNFAGWALSILGWMWMKFFLMFSAPSIADFGTLCVIIGTMWTFIANSDKAIRNIDKFMIWYNNKFNKK